MLRLSLSQGTPLGQGAGSLARGCRGHLGNVQGLCVRLVCALACVLGPARHGAGILRARIQLIGLLGVGRTAVGGRPVLSAVLGKGCVQ